MLQDNDFKTKHDSGQMTLTGLKKELDDLRFLLQEKNRSNNELQEENGACREQINRKEVEINHVKSDNAQKSDQGFQMRKDIDNLTFEASKLKDERDKD